VKLALPAQVAVVTGGGGGLGRALCLELARRAWKVVVAEIDPEAGQASADAVVRGGGEAVFLKVDTASAEQVQDLAARVRELWGGCDLLVNNAGVGAGGRIGAADLETWNWCLGVDLLGPIHGCHYFIPGMVERGRGHVVNVASAAAFACLPEMGPYNVAKAGVVALSSTLRGELAGTGVGVSVVCPAFFRSAIHITTRVPPGTDEARLRRLVEQAPVGAETIAKAVLRAVERNQFFVLPRLRTRLVWVLTRWSPNLAPRLLRRLVNR
jgi:NAD(P)-dependent dehydrogenase (short-subunit alcohol dehydrogenase family)